MVGWTLFLVFLVLNRRTASFTVLLKIILHSLMHLFGILSMFSFLTFCSVLLAVFSLLVF